MEFDRQASRSRHLGDLHGHAAALAGEMIADEADAQQALAGPAEFRRQAEFDIGVSSDQLSAYRGRVWCRGVLAPDDVRRMV